MYQIVEKRVLNPEVKLMKIKAPLAAAKAKPGNSLSSGWMRRPRGSL